MIPPFALVIALALSLAPAWNSTHHVTVATDGSGDFKTVQAAIDSVPEGNRERIVISIKNGEYHEQVRIHKPFLTLRGEDRKQTQIISEVDSSACPVQPPQSKEEYCSVVIADANDLVFENLTVQNSFHGQGKGAALSVRGSATRIVIANVDVVGYGGDTLVLSSRGEYYLNQVYVSGTYHIIVPRGTTYAVNCTIWCLGDPHCLFNEGILHETDKMVIRHSVIDGPGPFGLGSYFRDAAWYFIEDTFSDQLLPNGQIVREPAKNYEMKWGEGRVYFADNESPHYEWLKNNIEKSPAKSKAVVTPAWTFPDWNPESTASPVITRIEIQEAEIRLVFNEGVTVQGQPRLKLTSGGTATYISGSGTDTVVFRGPHPGRPVALQLNGGSIFASAASLRLRNADLSLAHSKRTQ
jgi:pectinesterase